MAIDKNSKAYNSLLNKGYTDEQIMQMYDTASAKGTTQGVVEYDPMADLTPEYIANMDMNKQISGANQSFSQYWDDSSRDKQSTRGWLNQKYTWEWVKTSDINYNPNLTTKDLNPNFVYGKQSQVYGTDHPWYISQRNDDIASALYNEWLTSREDVTRFLMAQNWFTNSSEEDRLNTIESVWKRLWAIAEQNREKPDPSKAEELLTDTSGKIYGKVTADEGNPSKWIDTLSDANSVFRMREEARVENLKNLIANNPADIAEAILSWVSPYWEQTMRDARQLYPEFMAEVEAEKKKKLWQQNVNAIASGWEIQTAADKVDTNTEATSYAVNNATSTTSATQLLKWIDAILESNDTAKSAQDLMGSIEKDMATLKNRLKNLRQEANAAFKWDVPDYLVNAYMNNKSQEIQNQLSILEDRYNAAYNRYKTELSHAEWKAELELKQDTLELENYKAKYSSWNKGTWQATMRTERNNNPTAMTTDVAKSLWLVLWVDYEIWDSFVTSDWTTLYTARLIGDPIETTIKALDNWATNPNTHAFYTAKWWQRRSHTAMSDEKWLSLTDEQKRQVIYDMLKREWGNMDNMTYYLNQGVSSWSTTSQSNNVWYDEDYAPYYQKLLDADYTAISRPEKTATILWYKSVADFRNAALKWRDAQNAKIEEQAANKPAKFIRKDGEEFDMSDTPTYDTLTYDQKNIVQQLLNLNKNPATVTKRQYGDDFEKILSAVKEINPNWSDADYWQADKVKKEWNTSSKNWSNSRNGTAVATAMDIYDIAGEFGNLRWKDWNGMLNKLRNKLSDEAYTKLLINLEVLASEYAWALKGNNAAPTEQEIADKKEILAANLWAWAMKEAAIQVAKTLYNKNANEAENYKNATLEKPPLVVTKEVADWMYNVAWITSLPELYKYTPSIKKANWWGNAPLTWDDYTYSWGIMNAINERKRRTYTPRKSRNVLRYWAK